MAFISVRRLITISVLTAAILAGVLRADATAFPDDAFYFDGKEMRGALSTKRCAQSGWSPAWQAELKEGKIVGHLMTDARNNEPNMMRKPQPFSLLVREDGTFGSKQGDGPHRLWLRWWAPHNSKYSERGSKSGRAHEYSGRKPKYQWVSGKVLKNGDIKIRVDWGAPVNSKSFCYGKAYFRNDIPDTKKISNAIEADPNLCSGDLKSFQDLAASHIKKLKEAGNIPKKKDYGFLNFRLRRLYNGKC